MLGPAVDPRLLTESPLLVPPGLLWGGHKIYGLDGLTECRILAKTVYLYNRLKTEMEFQIC